MGFQEEPIITKYTWDLVKEVLKDFGLNRIRIKGGAGYGQAEAGVLSAEKFKESLLSIHLVGPGNEIRLSVFARGAFTCLAILIGPSNLSEIGCH